MKSTKLSCDVLVAGGGPAGVPCALAAARTGARVILCQDRPVLGGNASSEQKGCEAGQILSGQTRAVHGEKGVRPGRVPVASHRWMSDPAKGLPAWIELSWRQPQPILEVQLTFDTGQHRVLTLSQSDAYVDIMEWGHPQPETVRDYRIWAGDPEDTPAVEVNGNYQRLRRHTLDGQPIKRLRVEVLATNGIDCASILEVRCY